MLPSRSLGRTGLAVSCVGLGGGALGGLAAGALLGLGGQAAALGLGGLGLGLATHSATLTLATLLLLGWLVRRAAGAEEAYLATRHGAAFTAYAARTPRFWPRFPAPPLPASLEVKPPVLWKSFVDAGSFMLLWALVEVARALQATGSLPGLLALP